MNTRFLLLILVFASLGSIAQTRLQSTVKPKSAIVTSSNKSATPVITNKQQASAERMFEITTEYGVMVGKLYNSTPLHRDNFISLVEKGFYDSLLFHRVIDQFMIQGGDPNSRHADQNTSLGMGSAPGNRVPAEFTSNFYHKKGALAAARDNNPTKASSNCQFYIVQGKKISGDDLEKVEQGNPSLHYSERQREVYKRIGGTPFLDQNYTVFGEVISGLNVVDKITKLPAGPNNRPLSDVIMKIRMLN